MDRTHALTRHHRRILGAGIAVSLAVHALVFASVRFTVAPLRGAVPASLAMLPPEALTGVWDEAPEVIRTKPVESPPRPMILDALGASGAGGAPPPPVAAAPPGGLNAPVAETGMAAFNEMVVVDPLTNGRALPVSFGDLPEAEFTVADKSDDDMPVYIPGSVGKAKRNWKGAGAGNGTTGNGTGMGIGVTGTGGGICPLPLPGRGGDARKPPVWKLTVLRF